MDRIISLLLSAVAVILGIVVHESAHALAAYALGDPTARSRGRFSLNPLNHIDPFGTVLLPLLLMLAGGPVFAYAKPVPVYLGNLKHPERDEVLVALAGPVSNVLLAAVFAALYGALRAAVIAGALPLEVAYALSGFLITALVTNLSLAFFNLIPLPPLDGSTIIVPFLKGEALRAYRRIQAYAMPILIVVLYLLPSFTGINLIGVYFDFTVYPLANWMLSFVL
ncbi:site-2 protease family protein [Enorma burkinafasonensis]|uniref:site-2 protease family protein n=1 Tax=Enorma burkinafasonensis TaxID=2590867 RepID=UPI0011A9D3BC|nr:site-2 protease family protein [Enorma burkinafasonensis]